MRRLDLCWWLTPLLLLAPRQAAAAPLGASLAVERSERANDCPDAPALTQRVERILQRSLAQGSSAEKLEVRVHFDFNRDEYFAQVQSLGAKPGERSLHDRGSSCAALAQAVSVAIALLLDKELENRAPGSESEAPPSAPAKTSPPATLQAEAQSDVGRSGAHRAGAPFELRASLEGGAASGLVGQTSPLLSEQLGVRLQRLIFDAGFNAALPAMTNYEPGSLRTTLFFGSARACFVWGERFSVGPCAAFGVGRLQGVGIGYQDPATRNLTWTAFAAGLVAEGPVWGRVFWGATGSLWLPTRRSSFSVQNAGTAWQSQQFSESLALRVGFRIY